MKSEKDKKIIRENKGLFEAFANRIDTLKLFFLRFLGRRDYLRPGIRDRIIRKFCDPDTVEPKKFKLNFYGLIYEGDLSRHLDWIVYFYGAYEKQVLRFFRDIVGNGADSVFLDIGANVGNHALFMSKCCGVVHAFEPWSWAFSQLESKTRKNRIDNIVLHKTALGDKDCLLDFFAPRKEARNKGLGSFIGSHNPSQNEPIGKLAVANADNYIFSLGLGRIDLIKIDVEGFEKSILRGLKRVFEHYRPPVFMEFRGDLKASFSGASEILSFFPSGYVIESVVSNRPFFLFFNKPVCRRATFDFASFAGNVILYDGLNPRVFRECQ